MADLSVVIPAYNEGEGVAIITSELEKILENIDFEIIFVDDGSKDDTWVNIEGLAKKNSRIVGVKLARNFGKEGAILAGLAQSKGNAVCLIDCDLQHPPKVMLEMYNIWLEGNIDIVAGVKKSRGNESRVYRFFANMFNKTLSSFSKVDLTNSSDFQLLDRKVVDIIVGLPERHRFFRALSSWVGFNRRQVFFDVEQRVTGVSKFNFFSSAKYAINNITAFASFPLQMVTIVGAIFFVISVILGMHTLAMWVTGHSIEGFTTVILLLLIIGAMLMFSLGVIGYYIGRIYEELKQRPEYLVKDVINFKGDE